MQNLLTPPELMTVRAEQVEAVMEACRAQGAQLAHIAGNLPLRLPAGPPPDASALPSSSSAAAQVRECRNLACGTSCDTRQRLPAYPPKLMAQRADTSDWTPGMIARAGDAPHQNPQSVWAQGEAEPSALKPRGKENAGLAGQADCGDGDAVAEKKKRPPPPRRSPSPLKPCSHLGPRSQPFLAQMGSCAHGPCYNHIPLSARAQ